MAARIIPKKTTVSGRIPSSASLDPGELAVNLTDGVIFTKHTDGSIVNLTGAPELHTHSISQVTGLQSALDGKVDSVNGQGGDVVLDTDDVSEGAANRYHTTARARSSVSATGDLSYNESTGVFSFNETYSTPLQIKNAYESNSNTNAYTDSEKNKLAGIESGAQVNVATNLGQSRNATSYTITSSTGTNTALAAATTTNAGVMTAADKSKLVGIESGAQVNTVDTVNGKTGAVVLTTSDVSEGTRLYYTNTRARAAIGVSGDLSYNSTTGIISYDETYSTPSELLTAIKTVDGSTSGLDADLLDGKHASAFATSAQGSRADSAVQPGDLASVATSGSYNDLTDKPDLSALEEVNVYSSQSDFPTTGESGKVYIAEDTGFMYRWNGTGYTQLTDQTAIWGQISGTLSNQTDLQNALNGKANTTTQVIAGTGLSGGGNLTANRTLSVNYGTTAGTAAQGNDSRLSNSREWTAAVVTQAEAEAGTSTTARKWTAQRVRQAILGWWDGSPDKTKLDGIESGAQVNSVTSVAGKTGAVTLTHTDVNAAPTSHTHPLSQITGAGNLASLSTNDSTTSFLRGDGTWATPPNTNTTYTEITTSEIDAGTASTLRTITGRRMKYALDKKADVLHTHTLSQITDAGSVAGINTNGSSANFLRGDGTWVTPPNTNTTYSEITTAEIDAGTASTLRTISGRRMKYALDKKSDTGHGHAIGDVTGLQTALDSKANTSTQVIAGTGLSGGGTLAANRTLSVNYGTTAGTAAQGNDSRLSNSREWTATVVTQAEAEAGTATTARKWTSQRVRQAIASWWSGSADKTKLDGIATGATANATDAQLRARSSHTGTQAISTIAGLDTALNGKVDTSDARLSDSREWTATTVSQAEAQAGTATTRRAWTAQRVRQAITGWWNGSPDKTKLDGIETGAQVNVATNLAMGGSGNSRSITSSTGSNVAVPVASTTNAGFMATGDKTKLDGIAAGAQVNVATNLGSSGTGATRTITSSTGSNTSITYSAADVGAVPTARTITAGSGLTGGGNLTANRTLSVDSTVVRTTGTKTIDGVTRFTNNMSSDTYDSQFGAGSAGAGAVFGYHSMGGAPSDSPNGQQTSVLHMGNPWGRAQIAIPNNGGLFYRHGSVTSWARVVEDDDSRLTTNLGQTRNATTYTITSSTGSNTVLTAATTSNAGVMVAADKSKLDGIAAGAQVNVATNLGQSRNATSYTITSSTGTNTALAAATTSNAGVMSAADKTKLNGLSNVSLTGGTNVSVTGTYPNLTISATDTNTTYSAGNGISLSGTTFSVAAGTGLSQQTGGLAVDSTVIRTTGDQNLGGVKTFTTRLRVTGTSKAAGCFYAGTSNPTNSTRLNYDGNFHAFTFIEPSDIRMKTEIEPIENALDKVNSITGYNYTMKDSGDRKTGVIAQEVLEVLPEAVSGNQEEGFSVAYGNMVGLLINAVKELTGQVDELKNEINALKKGGSDVG